MLMLSDVSHAVEWIVMPLAIAPLVGAAAISGITALLGANKQSKAATSAASISERLSRESLAEQRRIYEEERAREDEDRRREIELEERDRTETAEEKDIIRNNRTNAFGAFGGDLSRLSQGYAPAYGLTREQTDEILNRRNSRFPEVAPVTRSRLSMQTGPSNGQQIAGTGGAFDVPPMPPPQPPGPPVTPPGPPVTPPPVEPPGPPVAPGASSLGTTVWLRAPTGEEMEVPMEDAPDLIRQGAELIPPPAGAY